VYSVSHNLRGPLASLMGLISIAKESDSEHKFDDIHGMMRTTMRKLDETLREIVDYSRNARGELKRDIVDWDLLVSDVFRRLEYLLTDKVVTPVVDIQCDGPVISDSDRIAIVLTNLVSNAIIFCSPMRKSHVSITIRTHASGATITVSDNGIGIRKDVVPKVWNMFYRGNEASQGAGLGLYITREAVFRLRGSITLHSDVDLGTVVLVEIPNLK